MSHKWGEKQFRDLANYKKTKWPKQNDAEKEIKQFRNKLFELMMHRAADSAKQFEGDIVLAHVVLEFRKPDPGKVSMFIIDPPPRVPRLETDGPETTALADDISKSKLPCAD